MSSRAVRKLQGAGDIVVPGLEVDGSSEDESNLPLPGPGAGRKKAKKKSKVKEPVNPFDLLEEEEDISPNEEATECAPEDDQAGEKQEETETLTNDKTKKKKKRKKKKNKGKKNEEATAKEEEEDEIDAGLREVNALLGELPTQSTEVNKAPAGVTLDMRALLSIEQKNLNPDNEMRKIFGSRVVQGDQSRTHRRRGRVAHRTTILTRGRDNWPNMGKSGLTMSIVESPSSGQQMFSFDHNHQYQQAQFEFWDAVESLNPQNIVSVLNAHPYHVDSILQLSDVCKMSDDTPMAAELIERALFVCECCTHPLFNISSGNCRLDYRRQENRAFFVAIFRHIMYVGQRGCYRTALEFCKILLSMDTDKDPLCVLLMIDFYAIKAEEFNFLIRLFLEWEAYRNLSQLPNFAFSVPLAMFRLELAKEESEQDYKLADEKLQEALLMFPSFLLPLLDKCSVNPDPQVANSAMFSASAHYNQPDALNQLIALYVGRCFPCWKEPEVMSWLERNVREVMKKAEQGDPRVDDYTQKRMVRYRGTPRNIYRHIILSEIKDATAALPPEHTNSAVLSYDPLPPVDAIVSYSRPQRLSAGEHDSSALSMFFRSLLPTVNPDDRPEEPGGAVGGQDLRQGIGALMDAMRDLLNNIQPTPPPREDEAQLQAEGRAEEEPPEEFD